MKKMVLALTLALLGLAAMDANAFGWRGGRGNRCGRACEAPVCEEPCERTCYKSCNTGCPTYKVINEAACPPPICEKTVECKVRKPAVCIRSCRWVCPSDCDEVGTHDGQYKLVGGE